MVLPLLKRTLATFLSPELGFLGFVTPTRIHTPFIAGQWDLASCGDVGFRARCPTLQPRMTWLYVADRVMLVEKKRVAVTAAAAVVVMAEVVEVALMAAMGRKQARVVDGRRRSAVKREDMSLSARLSVRMRDNGSFWYGVTCCGSMAERDEVEGRSGSPPRECSTLTLTLTLSFDVVPSPRAKLSKS